MIKYIIFATEECPFCEKAIDELKARDVTYKPVFFNEEQRPLLLEMKQAYDWKTVPMVFRREGNDIKFIGGCDDLMEHLD